MEHLRETVKYNPEEGTFFKITYGVMKPFGIKSKGTLKIDGKPYNAAKLAWWFVHGIYPDGRGIFGYKDGNSLNWKISNLIPLFDIDNGKLIVTIGVSPTKPAEFVIFEIAQWTGDSNN